MLLNLHIFLRDFLTAKQHSVKAVSLDTLKVHTTIFPIKEKQNCCFKLGQLHIYINIMSHIISETDAIVIDPFG